MTVTEDQVDPLIMELAIMIARNRAAEQTIRDHQPDGLRCSSCTGATAGARQVWPCTIYRAAERARTLEQAMYGTTSTE